MDGTEGSFALAQSSARRCPTSAAKLFCAGVKDELIFGLAFLLGRDSGWSEGVRCFIGLLGQE